MHHAPDPRMPPVDHCVLRDVLERQARERPGQVFLTQANGTTWTYLETREQVLRVNCPNLM